MKNKDSKSFEEKYPNLAGWAHDGWVEIGPTEWSRTFIRILDEGGLVWEGKRKYASMDAALSAAERAITRWLDKNG